MKIDELKKAIRTLIRQEAKSIVAEEINKAMGKILVEMVKEIKSNGNNRQIIENKTSIEDITEEVIHTKNPKLNSVLAETARYSRPLPKIDNLAELMDGGFEKVGMTEPSSYETPSKNMDFIKQMVGSSPMIPQQKSVLDSGENIPDALKSVFKKDFRTVMKKIDEAKKNGGSGFIDANKVLTG